MVDAYEDFCGVERGRFADCTLAEMKNGAAFSGFADFAAGWSLALDAAIKEAEKRIVAIDGGGNTYHRPAGADVVALALRSLREDSSDVR